MSMAKIVPSLPRTILEAMFALGVTETFQGIDTFNADPSTPDEGFGGNIPL